MPYHMQKYRKRAPRRRRATRGSRYGGRRGKGFFGDVWKGVSKFGSKANKFLRKTKAISNIGKALGAVGVPYAGTVGKVAGAVGYGRRRRMVRGRRRYRKGSGISVAGGSRGQGIRLAGRGKKKMMMPYRGMSY